MKNATKKSTKNTGKNEIQEVVNIALWQQRRISIWLYGITPLICNRQSEKAKRELLLPRGTKTKAERESTLKHNPLLEYQQSIYRDPRTDAPTLILLPGGAVKSATCDSAVDTPGAIAAQFRRLVSVPDYYVPVYGIPKLFMTSVRQSGPSKTPDIRTRALLEQWAIPVTFRFTYPIVNEKQLLTLCANGGLTRGLGDGRVEKGALDFGQYEIVDERDKRIQTLLKHGGRNAQLAAMDTPAFFDMETKDLYHWFYDELKTRGKEELLGDVIEQNGDLSTEEEILA